MSVTLLQEDAVGECRRALLDETGRPFRLDVERWSERDSRARVGEVWRGLVRGRAPGGAGWFLDLGPGGIGLVEPGKGIDHADGRWLAVRIKTEATAHKGAVLTAVDPPLTVRPPDHPGRWVAADADAFLHGVEVSARIEGREAADGIDASVAEACAHICRLPGGGNVSIEVTRGLTAVDVDAADRRTGPAFALELNREAAEEIARQISLRGLGGLLVVDFLRMRDTVQRREIAETLRVALRRRIARRPEVLEISALGLCEALAPRTMRGIVDALDRTPPDEREALEALRALERIGQEWRGARLRARLSKPAAAWLHESPVGWAEALANRIGRRWVIEATDRPTGQPDIAAETA